jgi:hypothetical protein
MLEFLESGAAVEDYPQKDLERFCIFFENILE